MWFIFILIILNFKCLNVITEIYLITFIILIFINNFFSNFLNIHKANIMFIHWVSYFFMKNKLNPLNCWIILINNAFKSDFMSCYIHFLLVIQKFFEAHLFPIFLFRYLVQWIRNINLRLLFNQWFVLKNH